MSLGAVLNHWQHLIKQLHSVLALTRATNVFRSQQCTTYSWLWGSVHTRSVTLVIIHMGHYLKACLVPGGGHFGFGPIAAEPSKCEDSNHMFFKLGLIAIILSHHRIWYHQYLGSQGSPKFWPQMKPRSHVQLQWPGIPQILQIQV